MKKQEDGESSEDYSFESFDELFETEGNPNEDHDHFINEGVHKLKAELNQILFHKNQSRASFEDKDCLPVLDKIGKEYM